MTRHETLVRTFRELAALYQHARMSGHIALSLWNTIDAQFHVLGERLGMSRADVDALLDASPPAARGAIITEESSSPAEQETVASAPEETSGSSSIPFVPDIIPSVPGKALSVADMKLALRGHEERHIWLPVGTTGWEMFQENDRAATLHNTEHQPKWEFGGYLYKRTVPQHVVHGIFGLRPGALVLGTNGDAHGRVTMIPSILGSMTTLGSEALKMNTWEPSDGPRPRQLTTYDRNETYASYAACPLRYVVTPDQDSASGSESVQYMVEHDTIVELQDDDGSRIVWKPGNGEERVVAVREEIVRAAYDRLGLEEACGKKPNVRLRDDASWDMPDPDDYIAFVVTHARLLHVAWILQELYSVWSDAQRLTSDLAFVKRGRQRKLAQKLARELEDAEKTLKRVTVDDPSAYSFPRTLQTPRLYRHLLYWVVAMAELRWRQPAVFATVWSELTRGYRTDERGFLASLNPIHAEGESGREPPADLSTILAPIIATATSHTPPLQLTQETDTRDGSPLWVARLPDRISRGDYERLRDAVRPFGGYWSSYKKGFAFKTDPTDDLRSAGLADELSALARSARLEDGASALGDDTSGTARRKHMLGLMFKDLVAFFAAALCAGQISAHLEPAIDARFETIAKAIEEDYRLRKAQELDTCRHETAAGNEGDHDSDTIVVPTQIIDARPMIEQPIGVSAFIRYGEPTILEQLANEASAEWETSKAEITTAERVPDTWQAGREAYLESIRETLLGLRERRDLAYRRYVSLRNRTELSADVDPDIVQRVTDRGTELHRRYGGVLPAEMREKAAAEFTRRAYEGRAYEHYPTPLPIVRTMLDLADIQPGQRILEPSAGEGAIAEQIRARQPDAAVHVVEYDTLLSDVLLLKGFNVTTGDFLTYNRDRALQFDRIVMNPPFDRGIDIKHVYHAYRMLKDGGTLVAIVSGNAIDGSDEANYLFRDFVKERGSWRLYTPSEYMGPSGKLANGRVIGIVMAMLSVTKPAGDTFGVAVGAAVEADVKAGNIVYDTQGAQAWEIVSVDVDLGTVARNITTGATRTFSGVLRTGGRFVLQPDMEQARRLVTGAAGDAPRNADGTIQLPPRTDRVDTEMQPLRIVTSRPELMPPPPSDALYDTEIASRVALTPGQLEGINRALAGMYGPSRAFLLADGTGFGKTFQQLVVAASVVRRDRKPVVIITKSPSIITTSFYDDAKKLGIVVPEDRGKKEAANGTKPGITLRRFTRIEELSEDLDADSIYICSYHMFGLWKGDQQEARMLREHVQNVVRRIEADFSERRKTIQVNVKNEAEKARILEALRAEEASHPDIILKHTLEDRVREKNEATFGIVGRKLGAVVCDEAHAFKNYDPYDFEDGSKQAYRGMVLLVNAARTMLSTATPADKVEHIRYLRGLNVYKTEGQYLRIMGRLGFYWKAPIYHNGELVERGRFNRDSRMPPEMVLNNISRLFENLTIAGTMVKRELSLDNFSAYNVMIGGQGAHPAELLAVQQATNILSTIETRLGTEKKCKASIINEKKFALEPYKIQKTIELTTKELLEGRQVVIFCSLVNDSDSSSTGSPCSVVRKISTVNVLARELGNLFGQDTIGFVTGTRTSTQEVLGDAVDCAACQDPVPERWSWLDEEHERKTFAALTGEAPAALGDAAQNRRADDIRAFQAGTKRILIATPEAGGTGISLDDTVGNAPRSVIIMTAPYSSVEAVQIMGRINRAKTRSRQRVFFLWVNVPVDKRLRDIIAAKLRVLGAAVQGEVKNVSVEEAEFASAENVQENYDRHNIDKDGKIREHSLFHAQIIRGLELPSHVPFMLTHKETLTDELDDEHTSRRRYAPIRLRSELAAGGRRLLLDWMEQHKDLVEQYRIVLNTDRYIGPYLEATYNEELWQVLLNFMKPENTRLIRTEAQRFSVGDRVMAATDVIEADVPVGGLGTVTRVWERKVRRLDRESGKVLTDETGQILWAMQYDYMVEFDNGERANNLETWEITPAVASLPDGNEPTALGDRLQVAEGRSPHAATWPDGPPATGADTLSTSAEDLREEEPEPPKPLSLGDRMRTLRTGIHERVRQQNRRPRRS
ncbi:MAG: strawberry notch C-terminal domain-containing protein ['Candidatus Kapabacteria' thiocyanatum]|uniref:Helicase ATP-binding domain-containing protein n=1 Tax=Candidatus Kapaibacterium thiocyanatum TaxID=1895771 RepID=A0A1M3KYV6_9BACT|nr:strawberry notch C-terminal domain-containing protein ['Candidatus Kapabacteria' thiocyanatum]OJX57669.1 MAG: hypothetical protein BGO89_06775 ['Candidatus Kapabacteria' thiocyanatum]